LLPRPLYVCNHGVQWFLFHLVWAGSSSSILGYLFYPVSGGQILVIPISFHGQWSKIASMRPPSLLVLGAGSGYYQYVRVLHT
jgi:hypothetical protein